MTISKLSVILTGSVAGFSAAMAEGGKSLTGFREIFERTQEHIAIIAGDMFAGETLSSGIEFVKNQFEAIDATAKLSDTLGITTQSLERMEYAGKLAGASAEDVSTGMEKMLKALGEANVEGSEQVTKAFASIGLSSARLAAEKPEEAFGQIADGLNKIKDPATRAYDASQIFGRGWSTLGALIGHGSEDLNKAGEEADKFGLSLSRFDAAKVEAANDAITRVESALTGAADVLVVQLAPYLQAVTDKLTDFATRGQGATGLVLNGFRTVVEGVATAMDYASLFKSAYDIAMSGVALSLVPVTKAVQILGDAVVWVINKLAGTHIDTTFLDSLTSGLLDQTAALYHEAGKNLDNFVDGKSAEAARRLFQNIENGANDAANKIAANAGRMKGSLNGIGDSASGIQKVTDELTKLKNQVDEFGKSKADQVYDKLKGEGASDVLAKQGQALENTLEKLQAQKKAADEAANAGKAMYEANLTPAEKYAEKLQQINDLLAKGKISATTAERARAKAADELNGNGSSPTDVAGPSLLESGSEQAAHFISMAMNREKADSSGQRVASNTSKANEILSRIETKIGAEARSALHAVAISL